MFAATSTAVFAAPAPARLRAVTPRAPAAPRTAQVCRASQYVNPLRPDERPDQAAARREREIARVAERTMVSGAVPTHHRYRTEPGTATARLTCHRGSLRSGRQPTGSTMRSWQRYCCGTAQSVITAFVKMTHRA